MDQKHGRKEFPEKLKLMGFLTLEMQHNVTQRVYKPVPQI